MKKNVKTREIVLIAMLSALAFIVMLFSFPLPFFPPFLKIDFSDVVILFGGFSLGIWPMILIAIFKNLLHWIVRGAQFGIPIDQLASILSTISYCVPLYLCFKLKGYRNISIWKKIGYVLIASFSLSLIMFFANYFFITPYYFKLAHMTLPSNYLAYMFAYIPFNFFKGCLIGAFLFMKPFIETVKKIGHSINR